MAGLGRKDFQAGAVLSAADVDGYLMDQSVMKFANTAAAGSAYGTAIAEGMTFYLSDTDEQVFYNGASFAKQGGTGAAGVNKIINGSFDFWQRGTSATVTTSIENYLADRFSASTNLESIAYSQQTFTPGSAPSSGYEGQYFARLAVTSSAGSGNYSQFKQRIEDVRTLAGQTVTFSYWAKADATKSVAIELQQFFGSGGSSAVNTFVVKQALTTSWARYSHTITAPTLTGKTIGTGSYADFRFWLSAGSSFDARTSSLGQQSITFDIWGVQLEAGSVATPFSRAGGTLQGELAACQRYYVRWTTQDAYSVLGIGANPNTARAEITMPLPVTMRSKPTSVDSSNLGVAEPAGGVIAATAVTLQYATTQTAVIAVDVASGLTQYRPSKLFTNNSTAAYVGISAEL